MNRERMLERWEEVRRYHGTVLRVLAGLPADRLDERPIPEMRTPKELIVHLYQDVVREIAVGAARGRVSEELGPEGERRVAAGLATREALIDFARDAWSAADTAVRSLDDPRLAGTVKTPYGRDYTGAELLHILYVEVLHHRGQLYAFARALGVAPPSAWDFTHDAEGGPAAG